MRGTQGALIVASTLQIVVGFSGLWRNVVRLVESFFSKYLNFFVHLAFTLCPVRLSMQYFYFQMLRDVLKFSIFLLGS